MSETIAIIGDGGWGTALAVMLSRAGYAVRLWGPFDKVLDSMRKIRENPVYLPGVVLPESLTLTADQDEAVDGATVAVLAMPSRYFSKVLESFAPVMPAETVLVSVSKGFDPRTHARMTELTASIFQQNTVAALSGPSHAEEVARGIPTAVVLAASDSMQARRLQGVFMNSRFRVYTSDDILGVELGGALKNVIAVAVGISDGLGFGDNTRAALITRGMIEIMRLGVAMGARAETFAGLSGIGDLVVTCTSRHSRNRAVGERLGGGEPMGKIKESMQQVAEGVWNSAIAYKLARTHNVETPIIDQVHAVVDDGKKPMEAVSSLMQRDPKAEEKFN